MEGAVAAAGALVLILAICGVMSMCSAVGQSNRCSAMCKPYITVESSSIACRCMTADGGTEIREVK